MVRDSIWMDPEVDSPEGKQGSMLIKRKDGSIAEAEYLGDGKWLQYRWSAVVDDVEAWAYLDDVRDL